MVIFPVFRGQHQHGGPDACPAQLLEDAVTTQTRQHEIQNDQVVGLVISSPQSVWAVVHLVDAEALGLQAAPDSSSKMLLVVDDKDSHDFPRSGPM